ncbi:MAG: NmrA family NAD(P)-binding protein [Chthoniobacterales bacterium]
MSEQLVLVTGAAGGTQGKTGRKVTAMLLARNIPVRALVRRSDERSEYLRQLGAEVFEGDFLDPQSMQKAVRDVSSIYFAYPVQPGLAEATANVAVAARQAGVRRLINLVMLRSSLDAPTPRMRQNYLSEQVFEWAGIGAVHVRATVFYENVLRLMSSSLAAQGPIRLPWGNENTVPPLVAGEDVARVAVGLLAKPAVPPGSAYPLIGAVLSLQDILAAFSRALSREVRYQEISDDDWRKGALARGLNQHAVDHLSNLWIALRSASTAREVRSLAVTDTIEMFGGAKPKSFEEFLKEEFADGQKTGATDEREATNE